MKKIVWLEKFVKGGTSKIKLPTPVGVTGPIQTLSMKDLVQHSELGLGEPLKQIGR